MKYVGIKSCPEKRKALRGKGRIITVSTADLVARDCRRHLEFLAGDATRYVNYYLIQGKNYDYVDNKLTRLEELLDSIRERGYDYSKGMIVVSNNGARLDGSHRAAICQHLGIDTLQVMEVKMRLTPELRKHLKEQKRAYC